MLDDLKDYCKESPICWMELALVILCVVYLVFLGLLKTGKGEVAKDLFRGKDGIWFVEAHEPPREGEVVYNPLPYTQGLAYSGYDYDTDEC